MNRRTLLYALVLAVLLSLPSIADAANNIAINQSGNDTQFITTAVWAEAVGSNVSIITGAGNTTISGMIRANVNYSMGRLYGRVLRDGISLGTINLTSSTYETPIPFIKTTAETAGTHYYALDVYCTTGRKCTVYGWNMSVQFMQNFDINASAQLGIAQVTNLQGTLDGINTTTSVNDTNINATIAALTTEFRGNDTNINGTINGWLNQGVRTTDSPTFAGVNATNLTGQLNASNYNITLAQKVTSKLYEVLDSSLVTIASYVDAYSCDGSYCIYQPWYAPGQTYAKNMSTGKVDYSGTVFETVLENTDVDNNIIVLRGGRYESTNTNTIDSNNITIKGVGRGAVYINNSGSSHRVFTINGDNVTISDITIDANEPVITEFTGYEAFVINGNNPNIRNIKMLNSGNTGFRTTNVSGFSFDDIEIRTNQTTMHDGINLFYSDSGNVNNIRCWTGDDCVAVKASSNINIDNIIRYGNGINPVVKVRTWTSSGPGSVAKNININNVIGNNTGYGLSIWASISSIISDINANDLNFNNVSSYGIEIRNQDGNNTIRRIDISNFKINRTEISGVYVNNGSSDVRFSNGYITNSTLYGVFIDGYNISTEVNSVTSTKNGRDGLYSVGCYNCNVSVLGGSYSSNYRDGMRLGNNSHVKFADILDNGVAAITFLTNVVNTTAEFNTVLRNVNGFVNPLGTGSVVKDNYGLPPYNHGNRADCTTITAFGAMDSCGNTTLGLPMWWNGTFWIKADGTRP